MGHFKVSGGANNRQHAMAKAGAYRCTGRAASKNVACATLRWASYYDGDARDADVDSATGRRCCCATRRCRCAKHHFIERPRARPDAANADSRQSLRRGLVNGHRHRCRLALHRPKKGAPPTAEHRHTFEAACASVRCRLSSGRLLMASAPK